MSERSIEMNRAGNPKIGRTLSSSNKKVQGKEIQTPKLSKSIRRTGNSVKEKGTNRYCLMGEYSRLQFSLE
jgi:hypothetical protein